MQKFRCVRCGVDWERTKRREPFVEFQLIRLPVLSVCPSCVKRISEAIVMQDVSTIKTLSNSQLKEFFGERIADALDPSTDVFNVDAAIWDDQRPVPRESPTMWRRMVDKLFQGLIYDSMDPPPERADSIVNKMDKILEDAIAD